jgi:hypothetical protein
MRIVAEPPDDRIAAGTYRSLLTTHRRTRARSTIHSRVHWDAPVRFHAAVAMCHQEALRQWALPLAGNEQAHRPTELPADFVNV